MFSPSLFNTWHEIMAALPGSPLAMQASAYALDAWERHILLLDTWRQRGNAFWAARVQEVPNVLQFESSVVIDGRELLSPVNYLLLKVHPPKGYQTDPAKRPFLVVDPRAGQGPGIGGMKRDSEIGLALQDGHPVYFACFLPAPVPGQTIEDVSTALAHFLEKILDWHPDAGQPALIGNCQAGWQLALMRATHAALPGVLILAGTPLSFWNGRYGASPMRYAGGLTGGSWLVGLASDLGDGLFDGAHLIDNFEKNNPAKTLWEKELHLYTNIDREIPRYLEFERWWTNPIMLGREEIHFIVDDLFIGNHLATGNIHTSSGIRADLRNIKTPIVVFSSHGDDIASPQQALGWLLDIYGCDDDLLANEQTIIYSLHHHVGHLGIFVSASVADKELQKFISNIDMIETLPPGLFEATFVEKALDVPNVDLATGKYVLRFEKRSLDNIRALGVNSREDDLCFETVSRLSENWQGLYYTFISPLVRAFVTQQSAEWLRELHPVRVKVGSFSDHNPFCSLIAPLAETIRDQRHAIAPDNPFWVIQENLCEQMDAVFSLWNEKKDELVEALFLTFYASPFVQALVGLRTVRPYARPPIERNVEIEKERHLRLIALMAQIESGGLVEATIRGLLYVSRADKAVDEREYNMLLLLSGERSLFAALQRDEVRAIARQQYMMLVLDEDRAIRAIPNLLDRAPGGAEKQAFETIVRIIEASGPASPEEKRRIERLQALFVPAHATPKRRRGDKD